MTLNFGNPITYMVLGSFALVFAGLINFID